MAASSTTDRKKSFARNPLQAVGDVDPFSAAFAGRWFESLVQEGVLPHGVVLIPTATMAAEAVLFARNGFRVKVAADDREGRDAVKRAFSEAGVDLHTVFDKPLDRISPWNLGPVDVIADRSLFASLEMDARFAYVNRMGRMLPPGGHLAGIFCLGEDGGAAPRATPLLTFERLLFRYFAPEIWIPASVPQPGQDEAWCGLLRRK